METRREMTISRITLFSLLFGLLVALGIRMASDGERDACTPYLRGDSRAPASEWVDSGTREIAVPCNDWFMRQPLRLQLLCLLDGALFAVFILNLLGDIRDCVASRRQMRRGP
jgi:hypothetical protein